MSRLTMKETQAIAELASALYGFLPGKAHPYSRIKVDFGTVAANVGVGNLWQGGNKRPAISALLESTLQERRDRFCPLMIRIVQEGLKYRANKGEPITQEEMHRINSLIERVEFKIPELVDPSFIASLPREKSFQPEEKTIGSSVVSKEKLDSLKDHFLRISECQPQERGYKFEKFLYDIFDAYGFDPRPSFRIKGEQIDGSIELDHEIYLIEAKWQIIPIRQEDLAPLQMRASGHSAFGRGLFFTCGSFSPDGVAAFQRLGRSAIVGIDGQDLYLILHQYLPLNEVLRYKIRWLAETGDFHYPVIKFCANMVHNFK